MRRRLPHYLLSAALIVFGPPAASTAGAQSTGLFTGSTDIGTPSAIGPGSSKYEDATQTYTISGGGENMWAAADHFHYVWKKVSGDVLIEASVQFVDSQPAGGTPDPHRKACLIIRQSLDSNAVYADAARHGDGLTSLQWRDAPGAVTHEVQSNAIGPTRLRLEKRGNYVSMSIAGPGESLKPSGGAAKIDLTRRVLRRHRRLGTQPWTPRDRDVLGRHDRHTRRGHGQHHAHQHARNHQRPLQGSPRRVRDDAARAHRGAQLVSGRIQHAVLQQRRQAVQSAGGPARSAAQSQSPGDARARGPRDPDPHQQRSRHHPGRQIVGDQRSVADRQRPASLAHLRRAVRDYGAETASPSRGPSYFHGWSPDGRTLTYCAQRNGNFDVYTVAADGGPETRLTTAEGKDDGPEYSPDGKQIYFNSERTGAMQIWRMNADGTSQEQVTKDDAENWFPHVSPDGASLVYLAYEKGVGDHPENKDVMLKLMNLKTGAVDVLAKLFGGQGTINVASWSPNSQYLAFVSYQVVPE